MCSVKPICTPSFPLIATKLSVSLCAENQNFHLSDKFRSDQFKTISMCSVKPTCTPPRLSEVSPVLPLKQFQCLSDWLWSSLVLWRKIVECFFFACLSPPSDQCDVLGFVPTGSVSNSSTLQIFWDANNLWWLLFPDRTDYLWAELLEHSLAQLVSWQPHCHMFNPSFSTCSFFLLFL